MNELDDLLNKIEEYSLFIEENDRELKRIVRQNDSFLASNKDESVCFIVNNTYFIKPSNTKALEGIKKITITSVTIYKSNQTSYDFFVISNQKEIQGRISHAGFVWFLSKIQQGRTPYERIVVENLSDHDIFIYENTYIPSGGTISVERDMSRTVSNETQRWK